MKSFLLVLLLGITICLASSKYEKLSSEDVFNALETMDEIEKTTDENTRSAMLIKFEKITGLVYDASLRSKLYDLQRKNMNHTSYASKIMGLLSFQNVILVCMVVVAIGFIISLVSDLLVVFGAWAAYIIYKIFLSKPSLYIMGITISILTLYYKSENFDDSLLKYLFIFDKMTPVFGSIIAYITMACIYNDLTSTQKIKFNRTRMDNNNSDVNINILACIFWAVCAVYHNNWMVGVLTIMMLFNTFGFTFFSIGGGYVFGFQKNDGMIARCLIISLVCNIFMVMCRNGVITGNLPMNLAVFETGVYFWATFVGSIAMLILVDDIYMKSTDCFTFGNYITRQIAMVVYCFYLMFMGNIYNITAYQNIGGTFLVFWALDMERMILTPLRRGSITITLLIVLVNLWVIKQLISWYPEYFIF